MTRLATADTGRRRCLIANVLTWIGVIGLVLGAVLALVFPGGEYPPHLVDVEPIEPR